MTHIQYFGKKKLKYTLFYSQVTVLYYYLFFFCIIFLCLSLVMHVGRLRITPHIENDIHTVGILFLLYRCIQSEVLRPEPWPLYSVSPPLQHHISLDCYWLEESFLSLLIGFSLEIHVIEIEGRAQIRPPIRAQVKLTLLRSISLKIRPLHIFFVYTFLLLFQQIRNQHQILRFWIHILKIFGINNFG